MATAEEFVYPGELDLTGIQADYGELLIDGEFVEIGFNAGEHYYGDPRPPYNLGILGIRGPKVLESFDRWVFTNKRLLVIRERVPDAEPEIPAGSELDLLSIPYRRILWYHLTMRTPETKCEACGEPYPWVEQTGLTYDQVVEDGLDFKCADCGFDYAEIGHRVLSAALVISVQRHPRKTLTATIQGVNTYKLQNILARNLLR